MMWRVLTYLLLATVVNSQNTDPKRPIVETKSGLVQGTTSSCGLRCKYFSFLGLPYAEAPTGQLRFKNPQPKKSWNGVIDASKHGKVCITKNLRGVKGDEDCLHLNVFTQNLTARNPVVFYIHGGAFWFGSGNSFIYGMDNFVTQDIVAVTINYRIGLFGFLSTGDEHAQGNWGLKDQFLALKWVQENIEFFGGNPNDVTIFGQSAGAASVNYLIMSDMAKGLFHKAISNSGSALNPWAFVHNPREYANHLADHFNLTRESESLIKELRNMDATVLVQAEPGPLQIPFPRGMRPLIFVPSLEPENSTEPTFMTKTPYEIMKSGNFNHVPYLLGYNDGECIFYAYENLLDKGVFNKYNSNPHFLVPLAWNIEENTKESEAVYSAFQTFYWGGGNITNDLKAFWLKYLTDHVFMYGIDKTTQLVAHGSNQPVYKYQLSYDGDLGILKRLALLRNYEGVMHGDDLFYIFEISDYPMPVLPTSHARTVKKRIIKLWSNFIKYNDPTPFNETLLQNIQWKPVESSHEYLDIGVDLVPGQYPNKDRMILWNHLEQSYGNNIFTVD